MKSRFGDRKPLLLGRTVFLSASVPTRAPFAPPEGHQADATFAVEQAVTSLVRAVFAERGQFVFGGHPSISPLVAAIAGEYFPVQPSGALDPTSSTPGANGVPIVIYQSRAYQSVLPDETWEMQRFGFARIVWTDAVDGERFEPGAGWQCRRSLQAMRARLLNETKPATLVAIGGMQGVLDEAQAFGHRPASDGPKTAFAIHSTGGAAAMLAERRVEGPEWQDLRQMLDRPAWDPQALRVHAVDDEWRANNPTVAVSASDPRAHPVPPYPVIMQWLTQEIAKLPQGS